MADFASVLGAWRVLQFGSLQKELAQLAPHVAKAQTEAVLSRKALADRTREFKRESAEGQRDSLRPLLKAYQTEIDALTARAKQAENMVLSMNTRLSNAPDPYPHFEALVDQAATINDAEALQRELQTVRAERDALQQRCTAAEAQIRELGQRDADATAEAAAKAAEARADADRLAHEREESLQRELSAVQEHLRELRTSHEQVTAQLLQHTADHPLGSDAADQVEALVSDLERANQRASLAERRAEQIRAAAERARAEETAANRRHLDQLRERMAEVERAHAQQRANDEQTLQQAQERAASVEAACQRRIAEAEEAADEARQALAQQADYDEIQRELAVLKSIEFADDEHKDTPAENAPLEAHLVRRNHKLQDDMAKLRASMTEQQRTLDTLTSERDTQTNEVRRLEALTKRLESDLLQVAAGTKDGARTEEAPTPGTGLLPIVTSQRDRFRTRNAELEKELRVQHETMAELRSELKRLQADNVNMYEKVRYLQSFGANASAPTEMPYPPNRASTVAAYHARYEQSMNPFEAFRGREQTRALANLSPIDRALHLLASAILGNAYMRLVFVCYALLLHILVFGMLLDAAHRTLP